MEELVEILRDKVVTVNGFCYLVDRLNASRGCATAVTRVRIGSMKFRECRELCRRRFSFENERDSISYLCSTNDVIWK